VTSCEWFPRHNGTDRQGFSLNKAISDLLKRKLKPVYVILATCLIIFLSATSGITQMERQVAPAIAELKGSAHEGYGIAAFRREYLADPYGKAIGLSERQLQLCSQISTIVPAYESTSRWKNTALLGAVMALLFLIWQRWGVKAAQIAQDLKRKLNLAATQLIWRRLIATASERLAKMQKGSRPMKEAVVRSIVACPSCRQELRVPVGKGRIRITCSACGNKFETTT